MTPPLSNCMMSAMFAVIETGGKQYKVSPGDTISIEKVDAKTGDVFSFDKVLLVSDDSDIRIGSPYVKGAVVEAKVLQQGRGRKKIVFKYHSKARYRKKKGHRQQFTKTEITKISG